MVTRTEVETAVNEAGAAFEQCWLTLAALKSGKLADHSGISLLQFQPTLATALAELSSKYRKLSRERDDRVGSKSRLSASWFARRMRFISAQQEIISRAVYVGKSIGDAFAWFFYQNDGAYLYEHLKEPEQLLIPSGVGGYAELETVRKIPVANGHFVLYHGITSILRLGDFSLIRLDKLKVVTVGEIKAGKPSDGRLTITMLYPCDPTTGKTIAKQAETVQQRRAVRTDGLSASARDRLGRQMRRMASAHSTLSSERDKRLNYEMRDRISEFESFLDGITPAGPTFRQLGRSLLLIGVCIPRRQLYDRLKGGTNSDWKTKLASVARHAEALVARERSDNALYIASWFFREDGKISHRPGMTHPIWWPMSASAMKRVVLQDVLVLTVFNPAHLFGALEDAGFEVTANFPKGFTAEKKIEKGSMSLGGISHYFEMIQHYFFSEDDVAGMLQQVEQQIPSMPSKGTGKIEMYFEQRFGRPGGDEV